MRAAAQRLLGFWLLSVLSVSVLAAAGPGDARVADATKNQEREAVRALLKQRADVNAPQGDGATALHWATHWDDVDTVRLLLDAGAKVDAATDYGITPLSLACENRNAVIVETLLKAGAKPNIPGTSSGETPIMICARTGNVDAVNALIAGGADVNTKEPSQNQTALMWAVAEHHADVARTLIEHGADVRARSKRGYTALHFAARQGDLEGARLLLAAGVGVNELAEDKSGPLLIAVMRGHVELAKYLLDNGADPKADGPGFTPLHWASGTFYTQVSNPKFNFVDPMSGIPDHAAKVDLVKALLAHGADPNARAAKTLPRFGPGDWIQDAGATPFFLASVDADVELMRILVAAGADPALPIKSNITPLMAAAGTGRAQGTSIVTEDQAIDAVKYLLELNPKLLAATDDKGENALHGTAYLGWNRLIQFMVDKGLNVNVVSKQGLTPLIIAEGFGDREISTTVVRHLDTAALLRKLGADEKLGTRMP